MSKRKGKPWAVSEVKVCIMCKFCGVLFWYSGKIFLCRKMIKAVLQGVAYLQAHIDLFKAEYAKHSVLSDSVIVPRYQWRKEAPSQCPLKQTHPLKKKNLSFPAISLALAFLLLQTQSEPIQEADVLQVRKDRFLPEASGWPAAGEGAGTRGCVSGRAGWRWWRHHSLGWSHAWTFSSCLLLRSHPNNTPGRKLATSTASAFREPWGWRVASAQALACDSALDKGCY